MKKYFALAMLLTAAVVATSVTAASATASGNAAVESWSERSIVEGVALGVGPVAEVLGLSQQPTNGVSSGELAAGRRIEKEVLDDMMENHSAGVSRAVRDLTSGDPYRVEDGRSTLAKIFATSLSATNPDLVPNAGAQPRCGLIAACAVVAVLGAALGVAVVVVAESAVVGHAAIYAKQALWGRSMGDDDGSQVGHATPSFASGEFTARLTERLAR